MAKLSVKAKSRGTGRTGRIADLHIILIVSFLYSNFCSAFPSGGPDIACETMLPSGHGSVPQRTPPPYEIVPAKTAYKPGETISLIIRANEGFFTGIYVQAHSASCVHNDSQTPIGAFTSLNSEFQTRHCYGLLHSTLTQTNARMKIKETIFWTAPVLSAGHVVIKATFVKSINTCWTNVYSPILFDLEAVAPSYKGCVGDDNPLQRNATTLISSSSPVTPEMSSAVYVTKIPHSNMSLEPYKNAAAKIMTDRKLNITVISVFLVMSTLKIMHLIFPA